MNQEIIINQMVENAYKNLTSIAELNIVISGVYFGVIIPENDFDKYSQDCDKIINLVVQKICTEISNELLNNYNLNDLKFITYKSFSMNNPSPNLVNECYKIVNDIIQNKKDSNETNLLRHLTSLKEKCNEEERV